MTLDPTIWQNTPVFVTGHTGFKGSWLSLWLHQLGANIYGYALAPPTQPNLFEVAEVNRFLSQDTRADLASLATLRQAMMNAQPHVVFHLAAQPLVRESYRNPLGTFATNVMGTAHVLDIVRDLPCVKVVIIITTDKVYENHEWVYPYREVDRLGGYDPYSASKAAAELVVSSYRRSFFSGQEQPKLVTVRAGNVVGGGDWAVDRLVPDCLRAFEVNQPVLLRHPQAVRPWQHVLEPLSGYLQLAEKLLTSGVYNGAWNFGPGSRGEAQVGEVAAMMAVLWGENAQINAEIMTNQPHEASLLRLDITRARCELGWSPRWSIQQALAATIEWHRAWLAGQEMATYSLGQINAYQNSVGEL
ncbi:CDP-glucose 4,6-dehydratase [Candidatus Synechococcus calcipolaris G9]|uniref:CDP-glucose 4,6-dehydratase n=1 Tax=Candidatus Synechococcus calcipolaris G9 TaxID=1497997 RepID=A0ABT6EWD0_9SYNE|nr:CDP-glucose 4,6-dehydratase [Candidatus Synechococcus calcipolaris]MDG2989556.1 CDP-glucose 4,6-dehydratase [Candidatus Synechococcus calcipolaris G9]